MNRIDEGYRQWLKKDKQWSENRFYLGADNNYQSAGSNIVVEEIIEEDPPQEINNQRAKKYNTILEDTVKNSNRQFCHQKQVQTKKENNQSKTQSYFSSTSQILQNQSLTVSQKQNANLEKDYLEISLGIKDGGFFGFRLRQINIQAKCENCLQFIPSKLINKRESDLFFFVAQCSQCINFVEQITITFKKDIKKLEFRTVKKFLFKKQLYKRFANVKGIQIHQGFQKLKYYVDKREHQRIHLIRNATLRDRKNNYVMDAVRSCMFHQNGQQQNDGNIYNLF